MTSLQFLHLYLLSLIALPLAVCVFYLVETKCYKMGTKSDFFKELSDHKITVFLMFFVPAINTLCVVMYLTFALMVYIKYKHFTSGGA